MLQSPSSQGYPSEPPSPSKSVSFQNLPDPNARRTSVAQNVHAQQQSEVILRAIKTTETNASLLRSVMEGLIRNQERLRKKSLKMATVMSILSKEEDPIFSQNLFKVSKLLVEREAHREFFAQRVQVLTVEPLKAYPTLCSRLRSDIKRQRNAITEERKKKEHLDQIVLKDSVHQNMKKEIGKSQVALFAARKELEELSNMLGYTVSHFHQKKTDDIQKSISEYLFSEIAFHTKALEILTEAHQTINMDPQISLEAALGMEVKEQILSVSSK